MENGSLQILLQEFRTKGTDLKFKKKKSSVIYVSSFKNEPFIINFSRSYQTGSDILVQIHNLI